MADNILSETEVDREDFEEDDQENFEEDGEEDVEGEDVDIVDLEEEDEEEYENEEGEEIEELIPAEMTSRTVPISTADVRTLQAPVVIDNACEGRPLNHDNNGGDGGNQPLNRGEIDDLFCPICFEAWTSGGNHQICCLPCGHIYGLSCINKWLQRSSSSRKCPQCKQLCTLKDVRLLYTTNLCVVDEVLQKRVQSLVAELADFKQKTTQRMDDTERVVKEMARVCGLHADQAGIPTWLSQSFPTVEPPPPPHGPSCT